MSVQILFLTTLYRLTARETVNIVQNSLVESVLLGTFRGTRAYLPFANFYTLNVEKSKRSISGKALKGYSACG
jgi:hypothetical protein